MYTARHSGSGLEGLHDFRRQDEGQLAWNISRLHGQRPVRGVRNQKHFPAIERSAQDYRTQIVVGIRSAHYSTLRLDMLPMATEGKLYRGVLGGNMDRPSINDELIRDGPAKPTVTCVDDSEVSSEDWLSNLADPLIGSEYQVMPALLVEDMPSKSRVSTCTRPVS